MFRSNLRSRSVSLFLLLILTSCVTEPGGFDLFPVYRNQESEEGREVSVLWPLSDFEWNDENTTSWVFPFFIHWKKGENEEGTMVPFLPLYFHHRSQNVESTSLFPIYSRIRRDTLIDDTLLLFLADWSYYENEEGLTRLGVFPLFRWQKKDAGIHYNIIRGFESFPLLDFSLLEVDRTGLKFEGDRDSQALKLDILWVAGHIFDLFHYDNEGSHTDWRFLTLFNNEDWSLFQHRVPHPGAPASDTGRTVLFPFWWNIQHDDGTRTKVLWPPYGETVRGKQTIARYVLFPLLKLTDDPQKEVSGFDFLWPLVGHQKSKDGDAIWARPLFSMFMGEDSYEWKIILNAFGYGRVKDRSWIRVFWMPFEI